MGVSPHRNESSTPHERGVKRELSNKAGNGTHGSEHSQTEHMGMGLGKMVWEPDLNMRPNPHLWLAIHVYSVQRLASLCSVPAHADNQHPQENNILLPHICFFILSTN